MFQLLILLSVSLCLAYCSQNGILVYKVTDKFILDIPLVLMIIMLSLFCGLRTSFNDTEVYLQSFSNAQSFSSFINNIPTWTEYPLFVGYTSFFRHYISSNGNAYLFSIALFSLSSILTFIKRHSENFVFSILLFFSLGLYVSHMAAMKQCLAIAILTFAIEALFKKRFVLYYVLVFISVLFHTYAIFFVILPLFTHKPWTLMTYFTIGATLFALLFFESTINGFLSAADNAGKNFSKEIVFDNIGINPLRLGVFAVPPLLTFVFQEYMSNFYNRTKNILVNMSILSFLIMSLGIFSAANLFGRSAIYFELGTIIILPVIIKEIFDLKTARFITWAASACYLGFFIYSVIGFENIYKAKNLFVFLTEIIQ